METSSSLSVATVLAHNVLCLAERGWRGWLGLSFLFANLANRKSSVGCFQASWKRRR